MRKYLLMVAFIVLGAGCSLISEKVNLKPSSVIVDHENIGRGAQVKLIVEDRRPTMEIGYRNSMLNSGLITANNDIAEVFRVQMKQILESKRTDQVTDRGQVKEKRKVVI